jgi:TRAP transporter TAXI family solute receptor
VLLRSRLKWIAMVLVGVAVAAFVGYALVAPKTLRIAVGPMGSTDLRVTVAFLQALQRERSSIRLKLVLTEGSAESAKAFEERKVDLAVVRSDIALPEQSATVAILRREAAYFVTRPGLEIEAITGLRGHIVGLVTSRAPNESILRQIFTNYGIGEDEVTLVKGTEAEIIAAAQEGKLDAVFTVAPVSDRMTRRAFTAFPKVEGKTAGLLTIKEAEAIVEQLPVFDTFEISRGALGVDPPLPEEETTTLAVTHRLVARRKLDETMISELTRLLFALRLTIATEAPAAHQIELPSVEDRGAKLPVHAGTIAYIEGETKTFFDRYGDWFYLGVMGFSLVGSAAAALFSRARPARAPADIDADLVQFAALIERISMAEDHAGLAGPRAEAAALQQKLVRATIADKPDADRIAAIRFLFRECRETLADKRAELGPAPVKPA